MATSWWPTRCASAPKSKPALRETCQPIYNLLSLPSQRDRFSICRLARVSVDTPIDKGGFMPTTTLTNTTVLRKREQVAEGTMAFHFDKPAGFEFRAGQSLDWSLINPPETDAEGNTRAFSIASAPFDPDLMIATRMRDTAFK